MKQPARWVDVVTGETDDNKTPKVTNTLISNGDSAL
jgi:hypothetical protein